MIEEYEQKGEVSVEPGKMTFAELAACKVNHCFRIWCNCPAPPTTSRRCSGQWRLTFIQGQKISGEHSSRLQSFNSNRR